MSEELRSGPFSIRHFGLFERSIFEQDPSPFSNTIPPELSSRSNTIPPEVSSSSLSNLFLFESSKTMSNESSIFDSKRWLSLFLVLILPQGGIATDDMEMVAAAFTMEVWGDMPLSLSVSCHQASHDFCHSEKVKRNLKKKWRSKYEICLVFERSKMLYKLFRGMTYVKGIIQSSE